jgi:hypothetical protein
MPANTQSARAYSRGDVSNQGERMMAESQDNDGTSTTQAALGRVLNHLGRLELELQAVKGHIRAIAGGNTEEYTNKPPKTSDEYTDKPPGVADEYTDKPPGVADEYTNKPPGVADEYTNNPPGRADEYTDKPPGRADEYTQDPPINPS